MLCEYCNTNFKTTSSLNNHKIKAKYCLRIQEEINTENKDNINYDIKEVKFKCNFCNKCLSSKRNLEVHSTKCKILKEKTDIKLKELIIFKEKTNNLLLEKDKELKDLKELNEKIDFELKEKEKIIIKIKTQNENYIEQNINYKEQIKELQDKLDKIANKAIDRPTINTNNNTTLNIASHMDFNDIDKIKNTIENRLNINHVVDGQKGLANFVKDNLLTDDSGNLLYVCTDPSRHIFKYKDSSGEVKKDVEAKKLTSYILEGGIKKKSALIGNEWCKDDTGEINLNRFNIMLEQQKNIVNLSSDNSSFKKELASITTN